MRTFQVLRFLSFLTFRIYDVSCSSPSPYRVQNRGVSDSCAPIVRGKRCAYRITLKSSQFLGCTRGPNQAKPSYFQSVDQFPSDPWLCPPQAGLTEELPDTNASGNGVCADEESTRCAQNRRPEVNVS